jgi:hypothetical protein
MLPIYKANQPMSPDLFRELFGLPNRISSPLYPPKIKPRQVESWSATIKKPKAGGLASVLQPVVKPLRFAPQKQLDTLLIVY